MVTEPHVKPFLTSLKWQRGYNGPNSSCSGSYPFYIHNFSDEQASPVLDLKDRFGNILKIVPFLLQRDSTPNPPCLGNAAYDT